MPRKSQKTFFRTRKQGSLVSIQIKNRHVDNEPKPKLKIPFLHCSEEECFEKSNIRKEFNIVSMIESDMYVLKEYPLDL